ncbi:unnamed protein product [Lactuca saligna]|uniref:Uncharacterized protein n=1 Tax=Lactuca saligna TaxID=75948 RepID=A0AA35VCA1_LACSI|nr:unnamed protein product [Lactuca saligna]
MEDPFSKIIRMLVDKKGDKGIPLDQGDFLVHFMDIARDELDKTPNEISIEKLQDTCSLLNRLSILKDLQKGGETVSEPDVVEELVDVYIIEGV